MIREGCPEKNPVRKASVFSCYLAGCIQPSCITNTCDAPRWECLNSHLSCASYQVDEPELVTSALRASVSLYVKWEKVKFYYFIGLLCSLNKYLKHTHIFLNNRKQAKWYKNGILYLLSAPWSNLLISLFALWICITFTKDSKDFVPCLLCNLY